MRNHFLALRRPPLRSSVQGHGRKPRHSPPGHPCASDYANYIKIGYTLSSRHRRRLSKPSSVSPPAVASSPPRTHSGPVWPPGKTPYVTTCPGHPRASVSSGRRIKERSIKIVEDGIIPSSFLPHRDGLMWGQLVLAF